ncbi:HAMP domain-containing sensor histidine kinase [Sphaerisporangium sp. NPDC049002]|uniref:sensor histidine kinase n=1 Tax=Sphaerisporangium sp. NPDC049002 TaxID=3155392 RepID=UPI0033C4B58A
MGDLLHGHSIQARFAMLAAAASLLLMTLMGIGFDLAVRNQVQNQVFNQTQGAATEWIALMRTGGRLPPPPNTPVDVLQIVNSRGKVIAGNAGAVGWPPLSIVRPTADKPIVNLTECSRAGCHLITAVRIPPQVYPRIVADEPDFVYAGMEPPPVLASHLLEFSTLALGIPVVLATTWLTWILIGRTLRPVELIRARMSEISVTNLSLRVPEPRSDDEIGRLARTANQTLTRLEEAMEQQRRFAHVVSHELKTPLAGLRTQLEEALLYPDDVDPCETIRTGLCSAERLQELIDDLLAYARIKTAPAPLEPLDLGAVVKEEMITTARPVPVSTHVYGEVKVLGNRLQLAAVLNNLVVNAQRHAKAAVEVTVRCAAGAAVVTVIDDGKGIAPEDRERVFQPFVRLGEGRRRDPQGSGLGLAISRSIVAAHNGTLKIEDSPRGARFVLRLPLLNAVRLTPQGPYATAV